MRIFPRPKEIECLCCKEIIRGRDTNGIYRCRNCKSEIVEFYEPQHRQVGLRIIPFYGGMAIPLLLSNSELNLNNFELLIVSLSVTMLLWIWLRPQIKTNLDTKITYIYANGSSYPDQQSKKHQELLGWINASETDFIGFVRSIVNNSYSANFVDKKSMNYFETLNMKTETLPSVSQFSNWQSKYLARDMEEVERIKEKHDSELKVHIAKLKKTAESVDYFSE